MIAGVVQNENYSWPVRATEQSHFLKEVSKSLGVKTVGLGLVDKLAVPQAHRTKITDAAVGRMVEQNRVPILRRHPHATPRPVLLKADFIHGPKINPRILVEFLQFFYIGAGLPGQHGQ